VRVSVLTILVFLVTPCLAGPTTAPATVQGMLLKGAIRFDIPATWKEVQRAEEDQLVGYALPDGLGLVMIYVAPTDGPVNQTFETKRRMAKIISEGTSNGLKNQGHEVLLAPTLEKDDIYFMRLRCTYKLKGSTVPTEQLAVYRPVGLSLASVTVTATTEATEQIDAAFKLGEKVLDSVRPGKPIRPTGFPRARIWMTAPVEWIETKSDTPAGTIVTYRDPRDAQTVLRVGVRPMTKDAKTDTGVRQKLIDALLAERDKQLDTDGHTTRTDLAPKPDARYLLQTTTDSAGTPGPRRIETRVLITGDTLVAVTSVTTPDRADPVTKVADDLASTLKPIERK